MAQPMDPTQLTEKVAVAIEAGNTVDETERLQAAGYTAQQAATDGNTDLLDLIVLVGAGKYKAAFLLLVNMAFKGSAQSTTPAGAFQDLINSGNPATKSRPAPTGRRAPRK